MRCNGDAASAKMTDEVSAARTNEHVTTQSVALTPCGEQEQWHMRACDNKPSSFVHNNG